MPFIEGADCEEAENNEEVKGAPVEGFLFLKKNRGSEEAGTAKEVAKVRHFIDGERGLDFGT